MSNLKYCRKGTKAKINAILSDPAVHEITKEIIRAGLEKDSLDVVYDVELALEMLRLVNNDITGA